VPLPGRGNAAIVAQDLNEKMATFMMRGLVVMRKQRMEKERMA
jgi:hypothetical protein